MITLKHWISRTGLLLTTSVLLFHISAAHAVPFSADIVITGTTTFDTTFSDGASGDFSVVSGGTTTTSNYSGSVVSGANPLNGTLTDFNDGFGFSGTANVTDSLFSVGLDSAINISNTSADIYDVTFNLDISNFVHATGADAFSDSELTLFLDGITELAFSDLKSDTFFGDEVGAVLTGGFGDPLLDNTAHTFTLQLNPFDVADLALSWTLEGGDFATGSAAVNLSSVLSVTGVQKQGVAVPLPGTLLLVGLGMLLLPLQRRVREKMFG